MIYIKIEKSDSAVRVGDSIFRNGKFFIVDGFTKSLFYNETYFSCVEDERNLSDGVSNRRGINRKTIKNVKQKKESIR